MRGRALPTRWAGRSQLSLTLPCVPALSSRPRSDCARLLVSDAWGFGTGALRCVIPVATGPLGFPWPRRAQRSTWRTKASFSILVIVLFVPQQAHTALHCTYQCLSLALLGAPQHS